VGDDDLRRVFQPFFAKARRAADPTDASLHVVP
jgi:hypothetical protein